MKRSSDLEDSNASFEVCCAYLWHDFDMILWDNPFFTLQKNIVVFIQKAVKLKPNTLEIKFIHKKSVMIALCKCNSKMSTFLGGIFRQLKDKFALLLSILGQLKGKFILQLRQCFSGIPQIRSEGFHKSVQKLWRATFFSAQNSDPHFYGTKSYNTDFHTTN